MTEAALLAIALHAVASPATAGSTSPKPAASVSPKPYPCASTVAQALESYTGKDRLEPGFIVHTNGAYALTMYGLKDFKMGFSAWFNQRGKLWCVIATGGDSINPPGEIPYSNAERLMTELFPRSSPLP